MTTETLTDDGRVCLTNTSTNDSSNDKVEPGELRATVSFDTCLSSTCDTLESKNCTVDVSNGEVTIESSATIRTEGTRCSSDCGFVEVTCSVGSLDQGDYTLTHGSKSMDFSLPSDGAVCGAGTSPAQGASQ